MSITNGESVVTKEILNEYHQAILPYLGGGGGGGATYTAGDGINIDENNEISTDNMPSSDMAEVASPMPSVMNRRFKYSTEEQIVGEWIDGKPLYEKTFTYDIPITISANLLYTEIADTSYIKRIASVAGSMIYASDYNLPYPLPFVTIQPNLTIIADISVNTDKKLVLRTYRTSGSVTVSGVVITLQYTKITD